MVQTMGRRTQTEDHPEETEENPQEKEVELKEPQDYYPIPEEPEGELIDYDAISKTYKTCLLYTSPSPRDS